MNRSIRLELHEFPEPTKICHRCNFKECEMPFDFFVHCPDENCRFHQDRLRLLITNPAQLADDSALWPSDETDLYVSCPGCNVVSAYCHADMRDFPQDAQNQGEEWFRISFRCPAADCHSPLEFHALMGNTVLRQTEFTIHQKLRNETWEGASPCGHQICTTRHQYVVLSQDRGTMQGYKPKAFHWQGIR